MVEGEDKPGEEVEEGFQTDTDTVMEMDEKAGGVDLLTGTGVGMGRMGGTTLDHRMEMALCDKHHLIKYLSRSRAMGLDLIMVKPMPMDFRIDHSSPIRCTD